MKRKLGMILLMAVLLITNVAPIGTSTVGAAQPPQTVYVFDLKTFIDGKGAVSQKVAYDYLKLATALQGIVNRDTPQIYYYYDSNGMAKTANVETDKYWYNKLNQEGEYLHDFVKDNSKSFTDLLTLFSTSVNGVVVWDEEVPATSNVASTIAGVDNLLPVRYDPSPHSAYTELVDNLGMDIVVDLTGKFTGTGVIPDIDRQSTGSAKNDAYLWAKELYLDTGKTNPMLMTNSLDGVSWNLNDVEGVTEYSARVVSANIPEQIIAGETTVISLTVKNTGTSTWSYDNMYRLATLSNNSLRWTSLRDGGTTSGALNDQRAFFNSEDAIGPGETKQFKFSIVSPTTEGEVVFAANIVRDGVSWMAGAGITRSIKVVAASTPPSGPPPAIDPPVDPDRTPATVVNTPPATVDGETLAALLVEESLPNKMEPGVVMNISITLKNMGTHTWAENLEVPLQVRLATLDSNSFQWGERNGGYSDDINNSRVFMNGTTPAGGEFTFRFTIEAPRIDGIYEFSAQMIRDGKAWFGPKITKSIVVGEPDDDRVETPVNSDTFIYSDLFNNSLPNADYYIGNKAFFFDLSPDATSIPNDDKGQALGTDYNTLIELLAAQNNRAGENIFTIGGFIPWFLKYTNFADPIGSKLAPVEAEWLYADIVSLYNAQKDADAYGLTGLSNASVFRHVPLADSFVQNNDKGNNGKTLEEGKKYVTFYMGDFDAGAWTSSALPILWDDPKRGELPLAWSFVPNTSERVPHVYNYIYETMGSNDYFVAGDNGAGYLNPMMLMEENRPDGLPDFLDVWERYNIALYEKFDLDITGFLISGNSLSTPLRVQEMYSRISPVGVGNNAGFDQKIVNGTPFAHVTDMGNGVKDPIQLGKDLASALKRNDFLNIRLILTQPSVIAAAVEYVKTNYKDINFEVVDPYTYFRLYKESDEGTEPVVKTLKYDSMKAITPKTIDGIAQAEEWDDAAEIVISPNSNDVNLYGTVWGSEDDEAGLTSSYRIRWDDKNLYLLEKRIDDSLNFTETGAQMYLSDATMLFLDLENDKSGTLFKDGDYALMMTPSGPDKQPHMFIREGRNGGVQEYAFTDGQIAGVVTDTGYTMEVAIPWSSLQGTPFAPKINGKIGMSLLATDNDGAGNWGQIMWSGDGDNQKNWAEMTFIAPVDPGTPPGTTPTVPQTPQDPGLKSVGSSDLAMPSSAGWINVELGSSEYGVILPSNAGQLLKNNKLKIIKDRAFLSASGSALQALTTGMSADELANSELRLTMNALSEQTVQSLLQKASANKSAELKAYSSVIVVGASVGKNGTNVVDNFPEPLTISFDISQQPTSPNPVYLYKIGADGKLTYVPSKQVGGIVEAEVTEPGNYALIEYNKAFTDVPATHWAYTVIRDLSARQIVEGIGADQFNVNGEVTRAEFAVMLARAVGLTPLEGLSFSDVAKGSWYAGYIAAMKQAGFIKGVSANTFNPNDLISREQMAVIMMRVLVDVQINQALSGTFKDDTAISNWAVDAVRTATELGLLKGKPSGYFSPQGNGIRSEASQVIYNLLRYLDKRN